jgi:hypothetical protein
LIHKEYKLAASTVALAEIAEKGADNDALIQVVQFTAQHLMEIDFQRAAVPPTTRRALSARTAVMAFANVPGRRARAA